MSDESIVKNANVIKGIEGGKTSKQSAEKVIKLTQTEINIIEERLTLPAGTLPQELGGALANRLGQALKMKDDATTGLAYVDKIKNESERQKTTALHMGNIQKAKALREEEVSRYTKAAMEYITKTYGKEARNPNGTIIGYGDSIEVLRTRHLKKVW